MTVLNHLERRKLRDRIDKATRERLPRERTRTTIHPQGTIRYCQGWSLSGSGLSGPCRYQVHGGNTYCGIHRKKREEDT